MLQWNVSTVYIVTASLVMGSYVDIISCSTVDVVCESAAVIQCIYILTIVGYYRANTPLMQGLFNLRHALHSTMILKHYICT